MAKKYSMDRLEPKTISDINNSPQSFDALFGINNIDIKRADNDLVFIEVEKLEEYDKHNFNSIKNWDDFVESVRQQGILTPIIVRESKAGCFEILAGHNRTRAAKEVGLKKIPAIIKNCDDVEASVIVGVTNAQREKVTDVEWGKAYRVTYDLLKRQGGRPKNNGTHGGNNLKGKRTLEIVAEKYGVSKNTVQRKIRLSYLVSPLADMVTLDKLSQKTAVAISYLKESEQLIVCSLLKQGRKISEKDVEELRELSKEADEEGIVLTKHDIEDCLLKENKEKKKRNPKYSIPDNLFPEGIEKKDKQVYVLNALQYIIEHGIRV